MLTQTAKKEVAKQSLAIYWRHAWRHKGYVIGLMVAVPLALLIFQFLPSTIVARVLEKISSGNFERGDLWGSFGNDLLLYAAIMLFGGLFLWRVVIVLIWKLEMRVMQDLHLRIFSHLLAQSANFHANRFGGSLVSQTNKFVGAYIRIADTTIFQITTLLLSFIFTAIILLPRAPMVVAFILGFSAIFIVTAIIVTRKVRQLNAIEAGKANVQTGFLADAITNILAVKGFAGGAYERRRYRNATDDTRKATVDVMRASIRRDSLFAGMTNTLSIANLTLAAASVVLFDADVATVFLVVTYTSIISQRLWDFSQSALRNYNRALGDAQDMTEILAIKPDVTDPETPEKCRINKGEIRFEDMHFAHADSGDNDALFQGLNLSIPAGQKVGLVGHSGSGKTSLTRLLLRFSDVNSGEILIDGQNIAKIAQDDLRDNIAYVPQEPLLFHRSIRENISYGKPEASDEEIIQAAKRANAHEFIEKLPNGYETLVGERGVKLSGGQRQRIAIARAILKDAPILVLDEATSALDSESEKLIQSALRELMKGRTAIVIAHRLSTIQRMDRILVMDNGSVIEEGSHATLLKKKGTYATLWAHQSGGFIEE